MLIKQPLLGEKLIDTDRNISISIGEPYIQDARVHTINLNNKQTIGDYPRKIVEFKDFQPDSFKDGYLLSIDTKSTLKFNLSPLPFLSISNLGRTDIDPTPSLLTDKFLALNDQALITAQEEPTFSLFDLGDVLSLTEQEKLDRDGESLTYVHETIASTKDYYIKFYPGYWTLRPELKSLKLADDVKYTPNQDPVNPYRILRQTTRQEFLNNQGRTLITDKLSIRSDREPTLGNYLDYNGYCSFNEQYKLSTLILDWEDDEDDEEDTPPTELTITVDFSSPLIKISNTLETLEIINIQISNFPSMSDRIKTAIVDINNFEGLIVFTSNNATIVPKYENGIANMKLGTRNIFNLFALNDSLYITHKAVNLNNTSYLLPSS